MQHVHQDHNYPQNDVPHIHRERTRPSPGGTVAMNHRRKGVRNGEEAMEGVGTRCCVHEGVVCGDRWLVGWEVGAGAG